MEHAVWLNTLFENLEKFGKEGRAAVIFLQKHHTKIAIKPAKAHIGAWWTILRNINLNSIHYSYANSLNNTRVCTLIIHEVRHLQQGFFMALSVYGELDAWQLEWRIYHRIHGKYPHPAIKELMTLPLRWDRVVLKRAIQLMQSYASKHYRVDLLPLFPLKQEISYQLFRKIPRST